MNLKEFPCVEFWADTKWEPYKDSIQQDIRRHLTTYGKGLAERIEFTIDLDEGDEEWIYTAHFFPKTQVPADVVDPWKNIMADKANNKNLFTRWSHLWICVHQSHKTTRKIRLIPLPVERGPHGGRWGSTKWVALPGSRMVEPVSGQGWGVHRRRQTMGSKPRS